MKAVTQDTKQLVEIKSGWVIRQFIDLVYNIRPGWNADLVEILRTFDCNPSLVKALQEYDALVVQKNTQYEDAWQTDGPITALCDLKDKLYRLNSAQKSGAVLEWDYDKLRGTLFDIWIRSIMCLAWFGLNFKDDDLDDPELYKSKMH